MSTYTEIKSDFSARRPIHQLYKTFDTDVKKIRDERGTSRQLIMAVLCSMLDMFVEIGWSVKECELDLRMFQCWLNV